MAREPRVIPPWYAAGLLALGLLGWELCLWWLLSGDVGAPAAVLGPRLARDAAFLLPVCVATVAGARVLARSHRTAVETAALLSLLFPLLLLPVAAVRGLLQRPPAPPPPGTSAERPVSALAEANELEGRFLCAAVSPDPAGAPTEPGLASPLRAAGAGASDALLLLVPVFPLALLLCRRPGRVTLADARGGRMTFGALVLLGVLGVASFDERLRPWGPPPAQAPERACRPGAPVRTYAVAAVAVDLTLNAWGDHVPQGLRYVLEEPKVEEDGAPRPLVLRANLGECLVLHFTNRLAGEPTAPRIEGLRATVSGPGTRGFTPGTSLAPGQRLTAVLSLPEDPSAEGTYLLHDVSDGGAREARGLFGALVLEPAGAVYRSASTGEPLPHGGGWEALIDVPSGESFREAVLLYHSMGPPETADVRTARGEPLPVLDDMAAPFRPGAFGINYRSEPHFEREEFFPQDDEAPRPARALPPTLLRSYLGETVKLRVAHAGSAEFHVHHLHGWDERWPSHDRQPQGSPAEALQLLGPGLRATLVASGPPGFPRAAGDFLVHCHMPNHTQGGERLTWRVFDARQPHLAPLRRQ